MEYGGSRAILQAKYKALTSPYQTGGRRCNNQQESASPVADPGILVCRGEQFWGKKIDAKMQVY
jgi:hypothetical protein